LLLTHLFVWFIFSYSQPMNQPAISAGCAGADALLSTLFQGMIHDLKVSFSVYRGNTCKTFKTGINIVMSEPFG
jgi:hypothetical protein